MRHLASAPCTPLVPLGPAGHPLTGAIWLSVNGVERQRSNLADRLWPVSDVISFISRSVKLKAGDLIFTGTPPGVATLEPRDLVSGKIDGVSEFTVIVGDRHPGSLH